MRVVHLTTVDLSLRYLLLDQLRAIRDQGFEVSTISAPGPWCAELEAEGIRHIPWASATRAWDPGADARAFRELLGLLRRERFDLAHTHNPKPGVIGRVTARLAGVPCVVNTVHGLYATRDDPVAKRAAVLGVERLAARCSDLELYQSGEDLLWARRTGVVPPSRSLLLGNGIDLERFDPARVPGARRNELRRELGIPAGSPVVATVGRLVAEKGYRELFAAAARIRESGREVSFLVLGDVEAEKADAISGEELARAREHAILAGWRDDVRDLLALADVFVLPSWREGMPRSAIEAAAMGLPLVLTDIRGCREVARDGVEGMLVPPRRPAELAEAIERMLDDAGLRERMGAAARVRAKELFDQRRVFRLITDQYMRLRSEKGLGRGARGGGTLVRRARRGDAAALASIHRETLPDAFLPRLGASFLRRLYLALADDRGAIVLVTEREGEVVGFVAAVRSRRAFARRFYLRHGLPALLAVLPRLLRGSILRPAGESARYAAAGARPDAELLMLAIAERARGEGLAPLLVRDAISALVELGAEEIGAVVGVGQEQSNRLFAELGFERRASTAVHDGAPSNVWVSGCRS